MSRHLCLKWNNHSASFLKTISNIQIQERYCDATIACQGKYFPVHRIILSTCSDYFDEIFDRMQCQHPYIVFKDIEPREMEMLLTYMYQGEVNVVQEMLPTLIKAAEALRVKGLAVPDDLPSTKDSSGKKRSNSSHDNPQPKRRSEERRERHQSCDSTELHNGSAHAQAENNEIDNFSSSDSGRNGPENIKNSCSVDSHLKTNEPQIKEEVLDDPEYSDANPAEDSLSPIKNESQHTSSEIFVSSPKQDVSSVYIKTEDNLDTGDPFEEQTSAWTHFTSNNIGQNLPSTEITRQTDYCERKFTPSPGSDTKRESELGITRQEMNMKTESCSLRERDRTLYLHKKLNFKKRCKTRVQSCNLNSVGQRFIKRTRPFSCPSCTLRCRTNGEFQRHLLTHTGEKPFECRRCCRRFRQKFSFKRHTQSCVSRESL